jgi:hypothetical protein
MLRLFATALAVTTFAVGVRAEDPPAQTNQSAAKTATDLNPLSTTDAINQYIAQGWAKAGIKKPAAKSTDTEFLRRVFIDLIGRIATPEETLDFEQDRSSDKRARLVKRLIYGVPVMKYGQPERDKDGNPIFGAYTPRVNGLPVKVDGKTLTFDYVDEFADHWATMWTNWLMTRTTHRFYRDSMRNWLSNQIANNIKHDEMVRKLITASGVMNKNPAVNFIIAHLGDAIPQAERNELGYHDAVPITSRVTRLFLGLQTQCIQCHDHPFNKEWVQSDFWGVNAFFRQTQRSATPTPRNGNRNQMMQLQDKIELTDDTRINARGIIQYERRDGTSASTRPLFLKDYAQADRGEKSTKRMPSAEGNAQLSRRQVLAEFIIQHDNFANAYVNRVWGHLFGRGLNKEPSVDDFGSHNEVVHPELLSRLADDFKKYGYDPKQLLEAICTSDVYQLSHVANKEYADPKYDVYFARMPLKAMSPEVLFASLSLATRSEAAIGNKEQREKLRDDWMSKLAQNFGDDEGNELTFNGTVIQALLMMNGKEINEEITRKGNVIEAVMKKHSRGGAVNSTSVLDELFLIALNRHATTAELTALKDIQNGTIMASRDSAPDEKPKPGAKPTAKPNGTVVPGTTNADPRFYQDVFWALLNTTEFMLNH